MSETKQKALLEVRGLKQLPDGAPLPEGLFDD